MSSVLVSASSHIVWVDAPCDLRGAVQRIEEILAGYPIRPCFGSAAHHDLPLLAEWLARSAASPTREHAARAIRRYCEAREPAADIIADPATEVVMRDGVRIKGGNW